MKCFRLVDIKFEVYFEAKKNYIFRRIILVYFTKMLCHNKVISNIKIICVLLEYMKVHGSHLNVDRYSLSAKH